MWRGIDTESSRLALGRLSGEGSGAASIIEDDAAVKTRQNTVVWFLRDPGGALARLVRLARLGLRAELAMVVLTDGKRAVVVRGEGLPPEWSFSRERPFSEDLWLRTSQAGEPTAVEDLRRSEPGHFKTLAPLSAGSYLGVALRTREGVGAGAACVIDRKLRRWSKQDLALLSGLAESASAEIELERALHHKQVAEEIELQRALHDKQGARNRDGAETARGAVRRVDLHQELLTIASHELRTPLTPLKLWLQSTLKMLRSKDEPPSPQQLAQKLAKAARQVDRLTRLVDDLTGTRFTSA